MRRVAIKSLSEYFFTGAEEGRVDATLDGGRSTQSYYFYRFRHLFHPFVLVFALFIVLFLSSLWSRSSRVALLTVGAFGIYSYFRTRVAAEGLFLRRLIRREFFAELDEVQVVIEVTNASGFTIPPGLIIEDRFELSMDRNIHLVIERSIPPHSRLFMSYTRNCDAGMGKHQIGPLSARMSDLVNLFEVRINEDELREVQVYPRVVDVALAPLTGTPDSSTYGVYEVMTRGTSVNFAGVRPYSSGDSFRQIAWRISAKRPHGLMVKEFEKITNCDVSVILNLDPRLHVGYKAHSTWETAKDVVLSIVSQQVDLGNSVQLLSNVLCIQPSRGEEHFEYLCRTLMEIVPDEDQMTPEIDDVVEKYRHLIVPGSAVFYVSAFDEVEFNRSLPSLKMLRVDGVQVICVYIDASAYLSRLPGVNSGAFMFSKTKSSEQLTKAIGTLETHGISTYLVHSGDDIGRLFLHATRGPRRVRRKESV